MRIVQRQGGVRPEYASATWPPSGPRARPRLLTALAAAVLVLTALAVPAHSAPRRPGSAARGGTDPLRQLQWGLEQIHASDAWRVSTGGGVIVAVIDSGVDLTHPDLRRSLVPGVTTVGCPDGAAFCGNGSWIGMDGRGPHIDAHGTHVAGIIAATAGNGIGVAGVAPDARLMPIKALDNGTGPDVAISRGIHWAVDHGANVINMSISSDAVEVSTPVTDRGVSTPDDGRFRSDIAYATAHGVLVIVAAGNSKNPYCQPPANVPGVLCVVATDPNAARVGYSDLPIKSDLNTVAAPGGVPPGGCPDCSIRYRDTPCREIMSTVPQRFGGTTTECGKNVDYDGYAGTSMAAPHVAALAALLLAQCRTPGNVVQALESTARHPVTGQRGTWTPDLGYGLIDAAAAVAYPGAHQTSCPTSEAPTRHRS